MITRSEKGVSASTFEHATKTLLEKLPQRPKTTSKRHPTSHLKSLKIRTWIPPRVPDTHFYVRGGPEEATPLRKSTEIDDISENPRTLTEIYGHIASHFCTESQILACI